ncbi:hypothetical protein TNCV_966641 [Trichonephila clavipes]|nr:hypothetical protein TNCV_966641 [Trichonephila clavipes]
MLLRDYRMPRPPKLDKTAMGTNRLARRKHIYIIYDQRKWVPRTPAEAFYVGCLVSTVKHGGDFVMVWGTQYLPVNWSISLSRGG